MECKMPLEHSGIDNGSGMAIPRISCDEEAEIHDTISLKVSNNNGVY